MPEESFTVRDLGVAIARVLGLEKGDIVEVQRDKTNSDRIMIIRRRVAQER